MKKYLEAAVLLLAMGGSALAAAPSVTIADAWFRALPGNLPAGGYFTARNNGKTDLAITGARSNGCAMLMLHQSTNKGGMSGMDMVDKVALPAGGKAVFAPGGFHLMCDAPKMKLGAKVPVVITLSDGSSVAADFAVRDAKGR